ncbi:efflux transporter outer membrane subunit [Sphingomonas abietis]|uniref:Efflux transporter outer membrane subunit n=1 Tax=Sphingomonas abietis TaxID=3012344 RepID=A0ABY7NIM4_9SPHN|nr:efflux transporter outer membrane subunit [Sphingomonas abietis]WBO21369.1 efflux transporter outer membrane subunit [Sphingomonas abietis]
MRRLSLLALLLAGGCTVGPNYRAPTPPAPPAFAGPAGNGNAEAVDLAHWWQAFGDPELTRLIEIGLKQAPDLQTAESRVREARYAVVQARAAGLPSIDGAGNAEYLKFQRIGRSDVSDLVDSVTQGSGGSTGSTGTPSIPTSFHTFSAGFDASWELDIFGGVRRQVEAARAQAEATEWNARDARVSLAAEIAADYLQMRGYQEQQRIAQSEVDRQQRSLDILSHTAQVGLVPQGNAIRQRTQLAQAKAQIAPLEAQARTQMHALAVLVGEQPETLISELSTAQPLPAVPPVIPPGLPVDLIRRRPDVRAAERQLAASTADIGVAVADLYPKIALTAMPQLATAWLGGFFLGKTFQLTAQGQASFPIFDFGRRRAVINERKEQREQAYIQWRQTVLGALRDVEDALVRLDAEQRSNAELRGGVDDARRALATVQAQFQVGLQDYTPVLDGQQQLLQAQNSLSQSDVRLREDVASFYKAVGGGWSQADLPPDRPEIQDAPKR